jgi:hypothetical protein
MPHRFRKHYSVEEARALLPQVRQWLSELREIRQRLKQVDERLAQMVAGGADAGGESVNARVKLAAEFHNVIQEFARREIQIKDLERGLVDFPAIISGKEVFLCWEQDEDDIEFWHDLDTGYAGRERL